MKTGSRFRTWMAGALVLGLVAAVASSSGAAPVSPEDQPMPAAFQAESLDMGLAEEPPFDDAPYGVDPIVTGPVSSAFKERQRAAHCDEAVWPNIPAACYPD
jgi:hypothetical protein